MKKIEAISLLIVSMLTIYIAQAQEKFMGVSMECGTVVLDGVFYAGTPGYGFYKIVTTLQDNMCIIDTETWYSSETCIERKDFDKQGKCKCVACKYPPIIMKDMP